MAWKDNALGIVVDSTMDANFAELKKQGVSFVIIEGGLGFDTNPALAEQCDKAAAAGLPIILQYVTIPAIDDYTFEAPASAEIPVALKIAANRKPAGFIISVERYWTGWDVEQNHIPVRVATGAAINYTASELMHTMYKNLAPLNTQVMIRTNDAFVQKYAPDLGNGWTDKFGFVLADWRYRTRAADGTYSVYTVFPAKTIASIADLRVVLPPDGSKNPLVPGSSPQLKFWEFTGSVTMPASLVKGWDGSVKKVKAVLFNGDEAALKSYLSVTESTPPVEPPPSDPPADPGNPPADPGDTGTIDTGSIEKALSRITVLCEQMAADLHAIRAIFRD